MRPGDKVKFKESYDGCFKDFKGRELTVKRRVAKESGMDGPAVVLKEIKEIHLTSEDHLELI